MQPALPTRRLRLVFLALLVAAAPAALRRPPLPGLVRPAGGTVALVGARVIDGTGAAPRERCTVLIEGERIRALGEELELPEGAEVVDVSGKSIVPGLIDMHGHLFTNMGGRYSTELVPFARLYLAGGVTTVFTAGDADPEASIEFRDAQRDGAEVGTRIYCAGPYFNHKSDEPDFMQGIDGPEEARAKFESWIGLIDGVKVYMDITPEEFQAVVAEADAAGLTVTGHLGSLSATRAIQLGIDRLEHGIYAMSEFGRPDPSDPFGTDYLRGLAAIDFEHGPGAALIDTIVEHGIVIDPTIVILEALFDGPLVLAPDWERYLSPRAKEIQKQMRAAFEGMRAAAADPQEWDALVAAVLDKQRELVRRVHARGGKVVGGTDPVFPEVLPGYGLQREAEHFVRAGLSPLEAIRACTLDAAEALGLQDELGSLAPGKLADLIVLDGDPSADITALGKTAMVWQAGARYAPGELRDSVEGAIE